MTHAGLFDGIGGFNLAAEWAGFENLFHCEWDPFCRTVLKYYWPKAKSYGDITKTDFTLWKGKIDILTGGFPCQPFSQAGKRKGVEDNRYLWPEMLRAIKEIEPRWVIGENVAGITSMAINESVIEVEKQVLIEGEEIYRTLEGEYVCNRICEDLEKAGYEVQSFIIPACAVGAPHRRDRIWFVASYSNNTRSGKRMRTKRNGSAKNKRWQKQPQSKYRAVGRDGDVTNATSDRRNQNNRGGKSGFINQKSEGNYWQDFPTQSPVCSGNDGLPSKLDGITFSKHRNQSIKGYGNAIVPQVGFEIFESIKRVGI